MRSIHHRTCGILLSLCIACTSHATLLSVTNVHSVDTNDVYELSPGGLTNGVLAHIDRNHTVTNLPVELEGANYVLTANDDKTSSNIEVTVTFDVPTTLYLSIDNRVGNDNAATPPNLNAMTWVPAQGWQYLGLTWNKIGDLANPYSVYRLATAGTSHTFHAQNNGGSRNMYSIAAKEWVPGSGQYALIDIGPAGQRIESSGGGLTGAPKNNINGTNYGPITLSAGGFPDTYDFTVSQVDWRDRGNSTGTLERLVLLGEDFVKSNNGRVTLTLADLPGGRYQATSYHHDPDNPQSPRIQVFVSDAVSTERLQPTQGNASQATTNVQGLTTAVMTHSAASFEFHANGADPVVLRFNGTPGVANNVLEDETPVNGLELILVDSAQIVPGLLPFALIDFGPSTQRVESGSIGLPMAPNAGQNGQAYPETTLTNETDGTFTLSIDNVSTNGSPVGGIDWRDRGDSTNTEALVRLGEDHVKNNQGVIRVTLGDLPAATYRVESIHIEAGNIPQCESIRVYVTDARGVNVLQNLTGDADHTARPLTGLTTQSIMATASTFFIESNGADDVIVIFDGLAAVDTEVPLNALRLEIVTDSTPLSREGTVVILR